jgi:hypothetical protein
MDLFGSALPSPIMKPYKYSYSREADYKHGKDWRAPILRTKIEKKSNKSVLHVVSCYAIEDLDFETRTP